MALVDGYPTRQAVPRVSWSGSRWCPLTASVPPLALVARGAWPFSAISPRLLPQSAPKAASFCLAFLCRPWPPTSALPPPAPCDAAKGAGGPTRVENAKIALIQFQASRVLVLCVGVKDGWSLERVLPGVVENAKIALIQFQACCQL